MNSEVQVTFRNMESSQSVEEYIRSRAVKLDTFYPHLMGCRVAIEIPHRHHHEGNPYHIRIDLTVPGGEIVVKHEPGPNARSGQRAIHKRLEGNVAHRDLRLAINDAFKVAGRRLQDYARRQRGDTKTPASFSAARVQ
jgi:hypothetical protein